MNRSRRWFVSLAASLIVSPVFAQPEGDKKAEEKWFVDRALAVSPVAPAAPVLKYKLFPIWGERRDGNAAPIYLRITYEQRDETRKSWAETPKPWNEMPIDKIPLPEAKKFLAGLSNQFRQFDLGARRKTAEWNYTIDQGSIIDILLPDLQTMRNYAPMLALRARVALAENDFVAAARALETGFAFAQHVGEEVFLINGLVGIAIGSSFVDVLSDWSERPGAPNLAWSLAVMPPSLIDLRKPLELEERLLEMQFPQLADLDRQRTPEQWDELLRQFRTEYYRIIPFTAEDKNRPALPGTGPNDPASRSPDLAAARKLVAERLNLTPANVEAMPPAQVIMLFLAEGQKSMRDDAFKAIFLPYFESRPYLQQAEEKRKSMPPSEVKQVAEALFPAIGKVAMAQAKLERRLAAIRVIEALRAYAANHGGQLPDSLDAITDLPVPIDTGTGKPFEYRKQGATTTLIGRVPGEPLDKTGIRYTITVKK